MSYTTDQIKVALEGNTLPELIIEQPPSDEDPEGGQIDILEWFRNYADPSREDHPAERITVADYFELFKQFPNPYFTFGMYYLMVKEEVAEKDAKTKSFLMLQAEEELFDFLRNQLDNVTPNPYFQNERQLRFDFRKEAVVEFVAEFYRRVEEFKIQQERRQAPRDVLDTLPVSADVKFSEPTLRKLFVTYEYQRAQPVDALEQFNEAIVSETVPLVKTEPFFKVWRDVAVQANWSTNSENLTGYVRGPRGYNEFAFAADKAHLVLESSEVDDKPLLVAIQRAFPSVLNISDREIEVDARYEIFIDVPMEFHVFRHFLFTNRTLNQFFFINERSVTRQKEAVYLYYYPNVDSARPIPISISIDKGRTRAYISRCTRDKNALEAVLLNLRRCFSAYMAARVQVESDLQTVVGKEVWSKYKNEIVPPPEEPKVIIYGKLFKGSARSVQGRAKPLILKDISPETHFLVNPEGDPRFAAQDASNPDLKQALRFPKRGDDRQIVRDDGTKEPFPVYYYTCSDETWKYIGLKDEGDELYPICYRQNETSTLQQYLSGAKAQIKATASTYLIQTGKQLDAGKFGVMLEDVDRWMSLVEPQTALYRYGIENKTPADSILQLLHWALGGRVQMEDARAELRNHLSPLCSTETPVDQLQAILSDRERWIDPRLFYHALRRMYQVELILFTKDNNRSKTQFYLTAPAFHIEYDTPEVERYPRAVLVCINLGAEQDKMPVCEAVCPVAAGTQPRADQLRPVIATNSPLYEKCRTAVNEWYHESHRHHPFTNVVAQTLNTFGMTSWLHIDFRGHRVPIQLSTPIHSLDVRIEPLGEFSCSEQIAKAFLEAIRAPKTRRADVGYEFTDAGRRYFLPINTTHTVDEYERFEKISRILVEYACKLFSLFARQRQLSPTLKPRELTQALTQFADRIQVNPSIRLSVVPRAFANHAFASLTGTMVVPNLVVPNLVVKQRLMYAVRQRYRANAAQLLAYADETDMRNYYQSVSDFRALPNTVVLPDSDSFEKFRRRPRALQPGKVTPDPEATEPYILYHSIRIADRTIGRWLVQPCSTYGRAVFVATEWTQRGVNPAQPGERNAPHTVLVWASDMKYETRDADLGGGDAVVSVFEAKGRRYQAFLPY